MQLYKKKSRYLISAFLFCGLVWFSMLIAACCNLTICKEFYVSNSSIRVFLYPYFYVIINGREDACMEENRKDIEKLLADGDVLRIRPDGYSMYPMLVPGRDEAVIHKAGNGTARRGDVVLYRRVNGMLVLHRLHHRGKDGVYMVGDNQIKIEGPVSEKQVIGILDGFIRNGKYISTDNFLYKVLSGAWLFMRPFRRPFQLAAAWIKKKWRNI